MKQESVGSFAPSDALVMLRSHIRASNSFNFMSGGFVTYDADCRWTAVPGELPGTHPPCSSSRKGGSFSGEGACRSDRKCKMKAGQERAVLVWDMGLEVRGSNTKWCLEQLQTAPFLACTVVAFSSPEVNPQHRPAQQFPRFLTPSISRRCSLRLCNSEKGWGCINTAGVPRPCTQRPFGCQTTCPSHVFVTLLLPGKG